MVVEAQEPATGFNLNLGPFQKSVITGSSNKELQLKRGSLKLTAKAHPKNGGKGRQFMASQPTPPRNKGLIRPY